LYSDWKKIKNLGHFENIDFVTRSREGEWMSEVVEACLPPQFIFDFSLGQNTVHQQMWNY
jgi:hypothetical protein